MLDITEINEKRSKNNLPNITTKPLKININGRRFRNDEINIKIANVYETIKYDLDWRCPEIKDPWRRAKQHMILLDQTFGENSIDQIRFDHFFAYAHICDIYKWINRAYQFLKVDGVFIASFIDFMYLFNKAVEVDFDNTPLNKHVEVLQDIEKRIFTSSDASGLYYHRTLLTPRRLIEYLKRSFFNDISIEKSYHEIIESDIYEVRAVKDTNKKLALAPDGTLIETK